MIFIFMNNDQCSLSYKIPSPSFDGSGKFSQIAHRSAAEGQGAAAPPDFGKTFSIQSARPDFDGFCRQLY